MLAALRSWRVAGLSGSIPEQLCQPEAALSVLLRNDLCNAAELYYQNNKASFDFIKYKISQIDPNAEHPWDYSKEMPDEWYEN